MDIKFFNLKRFSEQNAWDNYQFTDEQIKLAEEEIEKNSSVKMSVDKIKEYENQQEFWNKFYEQHSDKFFKERNWCDRINLIHYQLNHYQSSFNQVIH